MITFLPGAIFRPGAVEDVEEILSDLMDRNPQRAQFFADQFTQTIENLVAMPRMGSPRDFPNLSLPSLRVFPVQKSKHLIIWYQPFATNDGIEIIRVLHHSRDAATLLADDET